MTRRYDELVCTMLPVFANYYNRLMDDMRRFFLTGEPTKDVGVSQDVVDCRCNELLFVLVIPKTVGDRSGNGGEGKFNASSLSSICFKMGLLLVGVIELDSGVAVMPGDLRFLSAFSLTAATSTSKSISVLIIG